MKEKIKIICLVLITLSIVTTSYSLMNYFQKKLLLEAFIARANCLAGLFENKTKVEVYGDDESWINVCADILYQLEK